MSKTKKWEGERALELTRVETVLSVSPGALDAWLTEVLFSATPLARSLVEGWIALDDNVFDTGLTAIEDKMREAETLIEGDCLSEDDDAVRLEEAYRLVNRWPRSDGLATAVVVATDAICYDVGPLEIGLVEFAGEFNRRPCLVQDTETVERLLRAVVGDAKGYELLDDLRASAEAHVRSIPSGPDDFPDDDPDSFVGAVDRVYRSQLLDSAIRAGAVCARTRIED